MKRLKGKITTLILGFIICIVAINPSLVSTLAAEGDAYVYAFSVKKIVDGTSPFDDDDEVGNDSSSSNYIVRTFDDVNYTLEYTTALEDLSQTAGTQTLCVEFVLEGDPSELRWSTDQINYLTDMVITMTREDGTVEKITDYDDFDYDADNLVVTQVVTGTKEVTGSGGVGSGTLAAGVCVKAAANGDTFTPTFTVWIDGNSEDEYVTVESETITVSAAPRYNIVLKKNSYLYYNGYFNLTDGTVSHSAPDDDDEDEIIYGQGVGYGITIQLYNDSTDKGLKGIELPTGDITFDITLSETLKVASDSDTVDVSDAEGFEPVLWDYIENYASTTYGKLGRSLNYTTSSYATYAYLSAPSNKGTNRNYSACYNGGAWTIEQDENDDDVYHVTISDYVFDYEQFHFPTAAQGDISTTTRYGTYIGCFSAGYVECVCQADTSQITYASVLKFSITASNLYAQTSSGQTAQSSDDDDTQTSQEMVTSDNTSAVAVDFYPSGTISKANLWVSTKNSYASYLSTASNSHKDGAAYCGDTVRIRSSLSLSLNVSLASLNFLQKFDTDYLTIPEGITDYTYMTYNSSDTDTGTITTLFAAKPDGTGWVDQDEMNTTDEESLIYFASIDDLTSAGYVCVGVLYEVREAEIWGTNHWNDLSLYIDINIDAGTPAGTVVTTENDIRAWKTESDAFSWTSLTYATYTTDDGETITAYGLGDDTQDWGFAITDTSNDSISDNTYYLTDEDGNDTGYVTPDFDIRQDGYTAVEYTDGTISGGGNGGYQYGNSLLIIGAKNAVDIAVADTTSSGGTKSSYDVSSSETTVTYAITPSLATSSSNNENMGNASTDLTIVVTVPSEMDVAANEMSSSGTTSAGYSYTCSWVENSDGSWTVTYIVYDVVVDTSVGTLPLVTEIVVKEVDHADELTVTAKIYSDLDSRVCTTDNGNLSSATINIIKLVAIDIEKAVDKTIAELGEDITFTVTYTNTAEVEAEEIQILDVLPYGTGDLWGSDFSGLYAVNEIVFDFSDAPETFSSVCADGGTSGITVYYSTDETLQDSSTITSTYIYVGFSGSLTYDGTSYTDANDIVWYDVGEGTVSENTAVFSIAECTDITAIWFILDVLEVEETIYTSFALNFTDSSGALYEDSSDEVQQPADYYANTAFQYQKDQQAVVTSNKVSARIVSRSISGLIWEDSDNDGIREDGEDLLSGVTVRLLDSDGNSAKDVFGDAVSDIESDENGEYLFENLAAGTYTVQFIFDEDLLFEATLQNEGDDDTIDSDVDTTSSENILEITDIVLPTAEELEQQNASYEYISTNNDAGIYPTTASLLVYKVSAEDETEYLAEAVYELYDSDDNLITTFTTDENGSSGLIEGLALGSYYLQEIEAPDGYEINEVVYEFFVTNDDLGSTITITLSDSVLELLPSSGGIGIYAIILLSIGIILFVLGISRHKKVESK